MRSGYAAGCLMMVVTEDWGWGVVSNNWCGYMMMGWGGLVDDCVETVVVISGIVNGAH